MTTLPQVEEISADEGRKLLRAQVRDKLGISLDEFLANVENGVYSGSQDQNVCHLVMLTPFAR